VEACYQKRASTGTVEIATSSFTIENLDDVETIGLYTYGTQ
jgi:hypothetical protein